MSTRSHNEAPRLTSPAARTLRPSIGAALRRHSLAVLCYTLLAIAFTWPTAANLQSAIAGIVDDRECLWNIWSVSKSISQGTSIFYSWYMFYPTGISLYFHTLAPLNSLLATPFVMMFGLTAAYNIMNMLWFILAAAGAYALAYHVTENRAAAFIAGLIYGFSPYMAFHLWAGQIALLTTGLLPLYLLALLVGLRERWPFLLLAAGLLLLIGLSEWHYLIFAVLLTGLVAVYEFLSAAPAEGDPVHLRPLRRGGRAVPGPVLACAREHDRRVRQGALGEPPDPAQRAPLGRSAGLLGAEYLPAPLGRLGAVDLQAAGVARCCARRRHPRLRGPRPRRDRPRARVAAQRAVRC